MSAIDVIKQSKISMYPPNCTELGNAILELAEDQATTFGLARSVADWAENAQDWCKGLEKRVKALEDAHEHILTALTAEQALRIDYVKAFTINSPLPSKEPAPDLDAAIDKHSLLFVGRFPLTRPSEFTALLRAFAEDLGVK